MRGRGRHGMGEGGGKGYPRGTDARSFREEMEVLSPRGPREERAANDGEGDAQSRRWWSADGGGYGGDGKTEEAGRVRQATPSAGQPSLNAWAIGKRGGKVRRGKGGSGERRWRIPVGGQRLKYKKPKNEGAAGPESRGRGSTRGGV